MTEVIKMSSDDEIIKKHYDLVIVTPGHSMVGPYVKSLVNTFNYFTDLGISFNYETSYSSLVHDAREASVSGFAEHVFTVKEPFRGDYTYNKMLWIDSDISWTPKQAFHLYQSEYDIVSGVYSLADGKAVINGLNDESSEFIKGKLIKKEPFEVGSTGFGFVCIKSGVFESLKKPWFVLDTHDEVVNGETYTFNYGEDISFFRKATRAGFKVMIDPRVKVVHHKQKPLFVGKY